MVSSSASLHLRDDSCFTFRQFLLLHLLMWLCIVGWCRSGSLFQTGSRCGLLLPGLWSWTWGWLSSPSGSWCSLARLAWSRSVQQLSRSPETLWGFLMTGCRLMHSSGLSCKCLGIAVWAGLWIWDLPKIRQVYGDATMHPPFSKQGPASRWHWFRSMKMEGSLVCSSMSMSGIPCCHHMPSMHLRQRKWKQFSLLSWAVYVVQVSLGLRRVLKMQALYTCILVFTFRLPLDHTLLWSSD